MQCSTQKFECNFNRNTTTFESFYPHFLFIGTSKIRMKNHHIKTINLTGTTMEIKSDFFLKKSGFSTLF